MGNVNDSDARGVTKDVQQQGEKGSNEIYDFIDLSNGGKLIKAFRSGKRKKDMAEVNAILEDMRRFLYNNGDGQAIPIADLVTFRSESRDTKEPEKYLWHWCMKNQQNVTKNLEQNVNGVQQYVKGPTQGEDRHMMRKVCWRIDKRGAVGESVLHLCLLNGTRAHTELAMLLLERYPAMINDIYISDEFYGENVLHMAIVNEDVPLVHYLCKNGVDIHERAIGAFFLPEDQKSSRGDSSTDEGIVVNLDTDYKGYVYYGEYPLSFAVSLGLLDMVRYLLARKACANKQDTNGNTALHMAIIHNQVAMYDLLVNHGTRCTCCTEINRGARNEQNLTPLTLAAKLGNSTFFQHILTCGREVFWQYGDVTCAAYSLSAVDTVSKDGSLDDHSALSLVVYEDSKEHLELLDGILLRLVESKWNKLCRFRFFQLLVSYVGFLIVCSTALALRPVSDPFCESVRVVDNTTVSSNMSYQNVTYEEQCDPCFLRSSIYKSPVHLFRGILEIVANVYAFLYLLFFFIKVFQLGIMYAARTLVRNPLRGGFLLGCLLVNLSLIARFACNEAVEDYFTVIALLFVWPYSLMFSRAFSLTGPFVVMIYEMIRKDFAIFFAIYMVIVAGFSQAMYLVFLGYAEPEDNEQLFSHWANSMIALVIMSLGEFGDLYVMIEEAKTPFSFLGVIIFILYMLLGALLIVNMLIAMMGNTYLKVAETKKEWLRQWARIVLVTERMLSKKQRISLQKNYSQYMPSTGERALIMRLHTHEDIEESSVSNDKRQVARKKWNNALHFTNDFTA